LGNQRPVALAALGLNTSSLAAMSRYIGSRYWFALVFTAIPLVSLHAVDRNAVATAAASITKDELKTHIDVLADDTFEGRESGSRGGHAASNYLAKEFERLGAAPAGDGGSYFQGFHTASRNILGLVEGSDSAVKNQMVVIGAHYDHVGYGRANNSFGPLGYIHNGADDNASGVAGLLEVLDALKRLPAAPRRSILLACWDAEEGGLNGSRTWVARPTLAGYQPVFNINMDMIGRMKNNRLEILGTRSATGLRRLVSEANDSGPAIVTFDWKLKADSDHWPFYERRVPFVMFHTGLHGDYHRPSDDAHLINHEGLAATAKVIFQLAVRIADGDKLPAFRDAARQEASSSPYSLEQPATPQPPRYGMPFRVEPGEPPKVIVTGLSPGTPAERSGIKPGDRLLEFQGEAITDESRLRLQLLAARGETTFLVERPASETPLLFKLTPNGDPVRVGVTWRLDDGEPGTVIVTHVIYGSAAHAAGVRVADRIYSVAHRPFQSQDEFVALLSNATSPLDLLIERDGRLHTATLTLIDEHPAAE
jgi:hypothetical protein